MSIDIFILIAKISLLLALFALALLPARMEPGVKPAASPLWRRDWVFLILVFGYLLLCLYPYIRINGQFNVDEGQMLIQAERYLSHPIPWKDVDGTTSGPFNSWVLSVALAAGAPYNYVTLHVTAFVLNFLTVFFVYRAFRLFVSLSGSRLALLPLVFVYSTSAHTKFTYYSSEKLPLLFLSIVVWLVAKYYISGKPRSTWLLWAGLLLGALPFAKLQASYCGVALGLGAILAIAFKARKSIITNQTATKHLAVLLISTGLVPALIFVTLLLNQSLEAFWISYIEQALFHSTITNYSVGFLLDYFLIVLKPGKCLLTIYLALLILIAYLASQRKVALKARHTLLALFSLIFLLVCLYSVLKSGHPFTHYAHFLFLGFAYAIAAAIHLIEESSKEPGETSRLRAPILARIILVAFPIVFFARTFADATYWRVFMPRNEFIENTVALLEPHLEQEPTMSIWGWEPKFYIFTQTYPATRDGIGHYVVWNSPNQDYFRNRYLEDLKANPPKVFVDAVAHGCSSWHGQLFGFSYETFPDLKAYIDQHYELAHTIGIDPRALPVRIFVRRDDTFAQAIPAEDANG